MSTKYKLLIAKTLLMLFVFCCNAIAEDTFQPLLPKEGRKLNVEDCVRLALYNNATMRNAVRSLDSSASSLAVEVNNFNSTLTQDGSVTLTDDEYDDALHTYSTSVSKKFSPGTDLSLNLDIDDPGHAARNSDLSVSVTQPLLRDGGTFVNRLDLENARRDLERQRQSFRQTQQSMVFNTASLFYNVLKNKELIGVRESGVRRSQENLRAAELRFARDYVPELDVSRAELQLTQSQDRLISAVEAYESSLDDLRLQMELPKDVEIILDEELTYEPIEVDDKMAVDFALANRPDIISDSISLEKQKDSVRLARNDLLPDLDLTGSYTLADDDGAPGYSDFEFEGPDWEVKLSFTYTWWDNSQEESLRRSRNSYENSRAGFERSLKETAKDVRESIRSLRKSIDRIKILEKSLNLAEENRRLTLISYNSGIISNLDVLRTEDDLTSAQTDYISALIDYKITEKRLQQALGIDYQETNIPEGLFKPIQAVEE